MATAKEQVNAATCHTRSMQQGNAQSPGALLNSLCAVPPQGSTAGLKARLMLRSRQVRDRASRRARTSAAAVAAQNDRSFAPPPCTLRTPCPLLMPCCVERRIVLRHNSQPHALGAAATQALPAPMPPHALTPVTADHRHALPQRAALPLRRPLHLRARPARGAPVPRGVRRRQQAHGGTAAAAGGAGPGAGGRGRQAWCGWGVRAGKAAHGLHAEHACSCVLTLPPAPTALLLQEVRSAAEAAAQGNRQGVAPQARPGLVPALYKTRMCMHWEQWGQCR